MNKNTNTNTVEVDFILVEYHFLKPDTYRRIRFEEKYDATMIPQKGCSIVIGNKTYYVERLVYFPFGDKEGKVGIRVYISE
jgi:hypothetical protein